MSLAVDQSDYWCNSRLTFQSFEFCSLSLQITLQGPFTETSWCRLIATASVLLHFKIHTYTHTHTHVHTLCLVCFALTFLFYCFCLCVARGTEHSWLTGTLIHWLFKGTDFSPGMRCNQVHLLKYFAFSATLHLHSTTFWRQIQYFFLTTLIWYL